MFAGKEIVASGEMDSYRFRTEREGRDVLHRIVVTGPINRQRRIPLYEATLKATPSSRFFCILDNRAGFENSFALEEMQFFTSMVLKAGITEIYGATITLDQEYPKIVELANIVLAMSPLRGEMLSTGSEKEAEAFIRNRMVATRDGERA